MGTGGNKSGETKEVAEATAEKGWGKRVTEGK